MRWLYKLENKFGRYYIPGLMKYITFGTAIVYLAQLLLPTLPIVYWLAFSRELILQGQVWRVLTFLFVPNSTSFLFIITLYFYYFIGTSLENYWGGFRFNVYYLIGFLGALAAGFITGYGSTYYLNMTLFLAMAAIAPDQRILLFFFIPIKFKWMALFYAVMMAADLINIFVVSVPAGLQALVSLAFSLAGFLLFFAPTLIQTVRDQARVSKNRRNWRNSNRK